MRLAGRVKLGYYPTPPEVVDLVRASVRVRRSESERPPVFLDPCAGEGGALRRLRGAWDFVRAVGIEVDAGRARRARSALDDVLEQDLFAVEIAPESTSLLWLNPPYDQGSEGRLEYEFLRHVWEALVPGGPLIFIVPHGTSRSRTGARFLVNHFEDLAVRRFPGELFERFQQVLVCGTRRREETTAPESELTAYLAEAEQPSELGDAEHPLPVISLRTPSKPLVLVDRSIPEEELARLVAESPLEAKLAEWLRADPTIVGKPVLPLHAGHVALLLSAGVLNGVVGSGADQHIVVGKPEKVCEESEEVLDDDTQVTRIRERFQVCLRAMTRQGDLVEIV